ncbi:unnamed protein product, partial [Mycena citricolor]
PVLLTSLGAYDSQRIYARVLRPLQHLVHVHLGIYLSDEMLSYDHIDHAKGEQFPFGPEDCLLCEELSEAVALRELGAALEFAQMLKGLRKVG